MRRFSRDAAAALGGPLPAARGPGVWLPGAGVSLADGPGCSLQVSVGRPVDPGQSTTFLTGLPPRLLDPS